MGAEEALQLVDELVFVATGKYLTDNQREVFQRSFQGMTYPEMAGVMHLEPETVKDIGFELWNLLSEVLGEKVTKKNFRAALDRAKTLHQQSCSNSSLSQKVGAIQGETGFAEVADDLGFVGRGEAIADLNSLVNQGAKMILIHAAGGVGKSKLAYRYLKTQGFDVVLELWMAKETQNITSAESVVEEWLRRYLNEEPGREFGVSLERLRQKLREPSQRIGVLIDNLEPALDGDGKFIETQRSYVELLRVLADSDVKAITLITSRERLRESAITPRVYSLEGLDEGAWQQYFEGYGIQIDVPSLNAMHHAYAGNAKAMEILAGSVQSDFAGNLTEYWEENQEDFLIERDLADLVSSQFSRLQQLDSEAYKLLCRLGCYRYQDVPTVPIEGLFCMLWDVPKEQCRKRIKALQDRSLISLKNGEFWLHPVVRAKAIAQLKECQEWEQAHQAAAEFWTQKVQTIESVEDAVTALESYFHYQEIHNFEASAQVLLKERDNRWEQGETLGNSFYRLGLLQQIRPIISQTINKVKSALSLGRLYSIWGDIEWSIGNIQDAISFHNESQQVSIQAIESYQDNEDAKLRLERKVVVALFNIGLCKVDLWELEEAERYFYATLEAVKQYFPENDPRKKITTIPSRLMCADLELDCYTYLAFLSSWFNHFEKSLKFLEKADPFGSRLDAWSRGYSLLILGLTYKNLKLNGEAITFFQQAISFSKESNYQQVEAKALTGLAEIYRIQRNSQESLLCVEKAIELLEQIGAKCDLAEAYFQFALTFQDMKDFDKSKLYAMQAVKLFERIKAPKQIERVKLAIHNLEI